MLFSAVEFLERYFFKFVSFLNTISLKAFLVLILSWLKNNL